MHGSTLIFNFMVQYNVCRTGGHFRLPARELVASNTSPGQLAADDRPLCAFSHFAFSVIAFITFINIALRFPIVNI